MVSARPVPSGLHALGQKAHSPSSSMRGSRHFGRRRLLASLSATAFGSVLLASRPSAAITQQTIRKTTVEDDVTLVSETFGDPDDSPMLLIMGAMASMLWWPDDFCQELASQGFFVIRYDHRDTGLSTQYPLGSPPYTISDLAEDAVRILDDHGISAAHSVAMSLGGMIAQIIAVTHPDRVLSLSLISTTPIGVDGAELPPTSHTYLEHLAAARSLDWTNEDDVIEFMVRDATMLAGDAFPHDARRARDHIELDVLRAKNFANATNHFLLEAGGDWAGALSHVEAPTIVIHGTADPVFPIEHGERLVAVINGAQFLRVDGGGHELHPEHFQDIISAITSVTR